MGSDSTCGSLLFLLMTQLNKLTHLHFGLCWFLFKVLIYLRYLTKKEDSLLVNPYPPRYFGEKPSQILQNPSTCTKKVPQLLDFDGIGTVANAKHPWLELAVHSPESNKSSQWSLMDLVHFGYNMLYSPGYTVEYWIHQNQAKAAEGFWRIWGS